MPLFNGFQVTDGNLLLANLLVVGVAVLIGAIGSAVAVSRFATRPRVANLVEREAMAAGFLVERVPEAGLWRLFSQPPRPRPVGR